MRFVLLSKADVGLLSASKQMLVGLLPSVRVWLEHNRLHKRVFLRPLSNGRVLAVHPCLFHDSLLNAFVAFNQLWSKQMCKLPSNV